MILTQPSGGHIPLLSSTQDESVPDGELLTVTYARVQPEHVDFMPKQEGFDQNIEILLSTFIFHAAPEPVISLYDFIMTTFVPEKTVSPPMLASTQIKEPEASEEDSQQAAIRSSRIRVAVNLASVQGMYIFITEIYLHHYPPSPSGQQCIPIGYSGFVNCKCHSESSWQRPSCQWHSWNIVTDR